MRSRCRPIATTARPRNSPNGTWTRSSRLHDGLPVTQGQNGSSCWWQDAADFLPLSLPQPHRSYWKSLRHGFAGLDTSGHSQGCRPEQETHLIGGHAVHRPYSKRERTPPTQTNALSSSSWVRPLSYCHFLRKHFRDSRSRLPATSNSSQIRSLVLH